MILSMVSFNFSIVGVWYLFFWIHLFWTSESNASFTVLSRFTVKTIEEMKFLLQQLISFVLCFSSITFWFSAFTYSWKLIGTRLPFWWVGVKILWIVRFVIMFARPTDAEMRAGNSSSTCLLIEHWIWWPYSICFDWFTENRNWGKESRQMIGQFPSSSTVNL